MDKIIGVYKITNTVTGDTYIGSSINVKRRWKVHKNPSTWKLYPSNKMYKDFASYGLDKFTFSVLYQCCRPLLRFMEQLSINKQLPSYNWMWSYGKNTERYKSYKKDYFKTYNHRNCIYEGKTYTFHSLTSKFSRMGFEHPTLEAKKYLVNESH